MLLEEKNERFSTQILTLLREKWGLCPSSNAFDIAHRHMILFVGIFFMRLGVWVMGVKIGMRDYGGLGGKRR
jgi:hypothetical protein